MNHMLHLKVKDKYVKNFQQAKKKMETSGKKIKHTGNKLRRPIPFFLAAVSVCDIQALTENRFAKKGADKNK